MIDGDTVILDINGRETRVRLIGVDTPETVHPSKQVEYYSNEVSLFLTNLLKGERVYLDYETDNQIDKYGLTLAYVYRVPDGLFVNLEIIRQGYGQSCTQYPFKYLDHFRECEKVAREIGKILWSSDGSPVVQPQIKPKLKLSEDEVIVYITRTGSKYYRAGFRHLKRV